MARCIEYVADVGDDAPRIFSVRIEVGVVDADAPASAAASAQGDSRDFGDNLSALLNGIHVSCVLQNDSRARFCSWLWRHRPPAAGQAVCKELVVVTNTIEPAHWRVADESGLTHLAYGERKPNEIVYLLRTNEVYLRGIGATVSHRATDGRSEMSSPTPEAWRVLCEAASAPPISWNRPR